MLKNIYKKCADNIINTKKNQDKTTKTNKKTHETSRKRIKEKD